MPDNENKYAEYAQKIRDNIVCGRCSASTLLLWEKSGIGDAPRGSLMTTITNEDEKNEESLNYLVRCSFFKFNVDQPDNIVHCEGFKAKK